MSAFSDALETSLLDHLLRATAYVPNSLELSLHTADPGESGIGSEVSGGSYARVPITNNTTNFPQCLTSGVPTKLNGATFTFPTATIAWGTITHWALYEKTTFTGTPSSGSAVIGSVADTSTVKVGMTLVGTGIQAGATVVSIVTNTSVMMSLTATATGSTSIVGKDLMVCHGTLNESRYVAIGDPPKIAPGEMTITLTNATSGGLTDFAKRKLLDLVFGAVAYTTPATVYAAAGIANPANSPDNTFTEWGDAGYTRQPVTFGAPSGGIVANDGVPGTPGAAVILNASVVSLPGPLTALGIFDDVSLGNALLLGPMGATRSVATGNAAKLAIGAITATLN